MIEVKRYTDADADLWNKFNAESKNPLFMFDRNYMDYHRDRFQDHSLIFYEDEKLVAILPMSERENELVSHGGLTYGGFITDNKMKQHTMDECVTSLLQYAETEGFDRVYYKVIPHIFHEQPAEEDRYALFVQNARIEKIEASTVINLKKPLKMPKGRKAQISRARREGVIIEERSSATDFDEFIALENSVLSEHHGTKAVHTGAELKLLHDRFPENIHLYAAIYKNKIIVLLHKTLSGTLFQSHPIILPNKVYVSLSPSAVRLLRILRIREVPRLTGKQQISPYIHSYRSGSANQAYRTDIVPILWPIEFFRHR